MNKRVLCLSAVALIAIGLVGCASQPSYVQHKKYGIVTTEDKNYEKDRAACEAKFFPRTYKAREFSGVFGKGEMREVQVANLHELAIIAFEEYRYTQTPVAVTAAAVSAGNTSAAVQSVQPKKVDADASPASVLLSEMITKISACTGKAGWSAVHAK